MGYINCGKQLFIYYREKGRSTSCYKYTCMTKQFFELGTQRRQDMVTFRQLSQSSIAELT